MSPISAPDDVGALWLVTLQRAMARASHDVKDALNGVSVNVEVIRSRAARADVAASAVAPFADAAGQQLERLTILIEAILALTRPARVPADVGLTLRRVITVCGASSSSADANVTFIDAGGGDAALTRVRGDVVRLALMAPLLELVTGADRLRRASEVSCMLGGDDEVVQVVLAAADRRTSMPDGIADAARSAGVRWTEGEQDLSLAFPRV